MNKKLTVNVEGKGLESEIPLVHFMSDARYDWNSDLTLIDKVCTALQTKVTFN